MKAIPDRWGDDEDNEDGAGNDECGLYPWDDDEDNNNGDGDDE